MFMFTSSIVGSSSSVVIGYVAGYFELSPHTSPKQYGYLIMCSTSIPCLLAMPCFLIAGYIYKRLK